MSDTKNIAPAAVELPYDAQMSKLREKLAGRPYCKDVHDMLPELTKSQIRNAVNGRSHSPLVLAALKIVVHKLDSAQQQTEKRLSELAGKLEELAIAA